MPVGDQLLTEHDAWLERQALAVRTRAAYRRWVREFLEHLEAGGELEPFFASDGEHDRRSAVADWRRRLVDRRLAPSTVNLALAAVTSLLDSRALRPPDVPRVEIDPKAPRALSQPQLRALQRETDRLPSSRDRAIVQLLMLTGVRIGELAALEVDDVRLTQRTGELVIRHGKGDRRRLVPLSRPARAALREWLADRIAHRSQPSVKSGPLWISRTGEQMSVRSLGKIVSAVMDRAGIEDSAHALRHTVATRLIRNHRHDLGWSPTSSATPTSRPRATTPAPV
jgi:site-specific recombinase XerD